jgi:hypothetical protein
MTTRPKLAKLFVSAIVLTPLVTICVWMVSQRDRSNGFVGRWAATSADCTNPDGRSGTPMVIGLKQLDSFEMHCDFLKVSSIKSAGALVRHSWVIDARCLANSNIQNVRLRASLMQDQQSLTIQRENTANTQNVQRCSQ